MPSPTENRVTAFAVIVELKMNDMKKGDRFEVVATTGLTDADWSEINKLQQAYKRGGNRALNNAMTALVKDPIRYVAVISAFFPDMVRETLKDAMAEAGLTEEDLSEMARKLGSPARDQ